MAHLNEIESSTSALGALIARIVHERSRELFRVAEPVDRVQVKRHQTVFVVRCRFESGRIERCVVKPGETGRAIRDAERLRQLHREIRSSGDYLRSRLVHYLGVDREHNLVLMEYVEGQTLEELLRDRTTDERTAESALRQVGAVMRHLRALDARTLSLAPPHRRNRDFKEQLEAAIDNGELGRWVGRRRGEELKALLGEFPDDFWARCDGGVNLADLQPKNVLVRTNGQICVIDVNYTAGNPAQTLAFFLVGLDLLALRWPSRTALRRTAAWKEIVLSEYRRNGMVDPEWMARDFLLYHAWKLVAVFRQHVARRPRARGYLAWFYGRLLRQFVVDAKSGREGAAAAAGSAVDSVDRGESSRV